MRSIRRWLPVSVALVVTACGSDPSPYEEPLPEEDAGEVVKEDVGPGPMFPDLGVTPDVGFPGTDVGFPGTDVGFDAGSTRDTGGVVDTGPIDVGVADVGFPDVGFPDAGVADIGLPDVGTPDTGPIGDPCASAIDLTAMGTLAGQTTSYTGTNVGTPATAPLRAACGFGTINHQVVLRYTPRATARLVVSTNNAGTAAAFDTVVWAQAACTSLPTGNAGLGCNDDSGAAPRTLASTFTTAANVTAGTPVYLVVAGYGGSTGAFALTVTELVPGMTGAACDPRVTTPSPCADGLGCVANAGSTTAGTCLADGADGGRCRITGAACDTGLVCSGLVTAAASRCRASVMVGDACDPARVTNLCVTGSTCTTANGASTCVADGSRGGPCRVVAPRCDAMLTCSTNTGAGVCREQVVDGGACDPAGLGSVCATGRTCAAYYGATVGVCTVDGEAGARCRPTGTACAAGLLCDGTATATTSRCRPTVGAGSTCDPVGEANLCAVGSGCLPSPIGWTCVADGARGGYCRASGTRCDTGLTCIAGAVDSFCRERLATAGAMCDATNGTTICATNQSCVATAGQTVGACAANGTAAGADCRTIGTRCDTGLACTTTTGAGWCQRAVTTACDWTGRVTSCPAMTACAPSSATAGACTMAVPETEPNNSPSAPSPTITASTVFAGSVEAGGRDCVGVDVPMGAALFAEVQLPATPTCPLAGVDPFVTVFNPMGRLIAYEDDSPGRNRCSLLDPTAHPEVTNLAAGRYVVCLNGYNGAAVPSYLFTVGVVR